MEFGFLIDQRKCIGCHACTVACKSENDVPVQNFRTWVKYVDKGQFPEVRRHFTVLRCNHCDAAPCVEICPVSALHKREDAIVDLDRDLCIGCQACMQACPYDALYLNPDTGTAEKCHYCAHRTEVGLEPACVVVCPEQAIVSGDVADPESKIARQIAELPTQQRRLDKGTKPRVWYVDALEEAIVPGATREPDSWLWSDRMSPPPDALPPNTSHAQAHAAHGVDVLPPPSERAASPQPSPAATESERGEAWTTLNVDHPPVWGWHIWSYLFTKNVAAGAMILAPLAASLGAHAWTNIWPELVALVFLGITGFLLVHDLGKPERFLKILTHANNKSWLVKGTYVLMGFGALTTASLAAGFFDFDGVQQVLRWINIPFAVMASGYSAFLFAQCKGRDLWLESGMFMQLILRASVLGAGLMWIFSAGVPALSEQTETPNLADPACSSWLFAGLCALNMLASLWEWRRTMRHEGSGKAHAWLEEQGGYGALTRSFALATVAGLTLSVVSFGSVEISSLLRVAVVAGMSYALFRFERLWIRAGQLFPIS